MRIWNRHWTDRLVGVLRRTGEWLDRRPWMVLFFLVVPLLFQIGNEWYATPDSLSYQSIARSFWQEGGPRHLGQKQLYYPPGYPLLLSPVMVLGGERPFAAILGFHVALAGLLAVVVWRWGRLLGAPGLLLAALTLVNASFCLHLRRPLSEIAFTTVLFSSGFLLAKALRTQGGKAWILLLAGGLLAGYLGTIRQAGLTIVGGCWLALVLQVARRERSLISGLLIGGVITALSVAPSVVVMMHERGLAAQSGQTNYLGQLFGQSHFWENVAESVRLRIAETGRLLLPGFFKTYDGPGEWGVVQFVYLLVSGAVLAGWLRLMRSQADVLVCAVPFYAALYVIWPYDQGTRFFLPLLPVLWLCVWELVQNWRLASVLFTGLLLAHSGVSVGHFFRDWEIARRQNTRWEDARSCAGELKVLGKPVSFFAPSPDGGARLFVEFFLDRPLGIATPEVPYPPVRPVLVTLGQTAPDQFVRHSVHGDYSIWVRRPSDP